MRKAFTTTVILLLLISLSLACAHAEQKRARILVGAREAIVVPTPVYDGNRVLAPVGVLNSIGASHIMAPSGKSVEIIGASGQSGSVDVVDVDGTAVLPMDEVTETLGIDAAWDAPNSALRLTARLIAVEYVDDTLKITCSMPVGYTSHMWDGKLVIDISGTRVSTDAQEIYIGAPLVERARLGEPAQGTARVVLDLTKEVGWKFESQPVASHILLKVGANLPRPVTTKPAASASSKSSGGGKPFSITGISLNSIDDNRFDILISTVGKGTAAVDYGVMPPQVVLNLKGGSFAGGFQQPQLSHPLINGSRISSSGGIKIVLDLNRIVVYDVGIDNDTIRLSVRIPNRAGGKLADKFIVIDPGHGGSQTGASYAGVHEKDLNMRIAQALAAALEREGARTLLTRSGDTTMGLSARPEVALNNRADFFISIHCNSNGVKNSATGIETYYHLNESSPRALAYAVHAGVCSATGMCDRKARSDGSLYSTGLAVLRRLENTGLPGILLECGYLNHSSDRAKLTDSNYRAKLAEGIVAGLKAYVEGTPIR